MFHFHDNRALYYSTTNSHKYTPNTKPHNKPTKSSLSYTLKKKHVPSHVPNTTFSFTLRKKQNKMLISFQNMQEDNFRKRKHANEAFPNKRARTEAACINNESITRLLHGLYAHHYGCEGFDPHQLQNTRLNHAVQTTEHNHSHVCPVKREIVVKVHDALIGSFCGCFNV